MDGEGRCIRVRSLPDQIWGPRTDYRASHHRLRPTHGPHVHDPAVPVAPSRILQERDVIEGDDRPVRTIFSEV